MENPSVIISAQSRHELAVIYFATIVRVVIEVAHSGVRRIGVSDLHAATALRASWTNRILGRDGCLT
jgi:hypothetical protein